MTQNSSARLRLFLLLFATILVLPLIYLNVAFDQMLPLRFLFANLTLLTVLALVLFAGKGELDASFSNVLNLSIFVALGIYVSFALLSLLGAVNLSEGIFDVARSATAAIFLIVSCLIFLNCRESLDWLTKFITAGGLVMAAIGFCQYYDFAFMSIPGNIAPYGTMFNKNLHASILALCLPFSLLGFIRYRQHWFLLSSCSLTLIILNITLCQTRSVWLSLGLATITCTPLIITHALRRHQTAQRKKWILIRMTGLSAFTVLIVLSAQLGLIVRGDQPKVLKRLESTWNFGHTSVRERIVLWEKSWEIIKEKPLTGVGAGNWKLVFPSKGTQQTRAETGEVSYLQPHDDYLWVASETGIPGLLAYAFFLGSGFFYILRILRKSSSNEDKLVCSILLCGLIAYSLDSAFSFPRERIDHLCFLMLYLAAVVTLYRRTFPVEKSGDPTLMRGLLSVALICTLVLVVIGFIRLTADIHAKKILEAYQRHDWQEVIHEVDIAESYFMTLLPSSAPLGYYRGVANFALDRHDRACADFAEAYGSHPSHPGVLTNLGVCREEAYDDDSAVVLYKRALNIAPRFDRAIFNLAAVYFRKERFSTTDSLLQLLSESFTDPSLEYYKNELKMRLAPVE